MPEPIKLLFLIVFAYQSNRFPVRFFNASQEYFMQIFPVKIDNPIAEMRQKIM